MTRYFHVPLGVLDGRPCVRADGSGTIAGTPFRRETYADGSWTAWYDPFAVPPELEALGTALAESGAAFGLPYQMPTAIPSPPSPWRGRMVTIATVALMAGLFVTQVHALFDAPSIVSALAPVMLPIVALLHTRRRHRLTLLSWLGLLQVPLVVLAGIGASLWLLGRHRRAERWMRPSGKRLLLVSAAAFVCMEGVGRLSSLLGT